jgi:hypothetical protein
MMTTQAPTKLPNLATIVHESEAAAEAAAAAQAKALEAQTRADQARERADEERAAAYRSFLDVVVKEAPERRSAALTKAGECRAALEDAVRNGGDVFTSYRAWVEARIVIWEIDSELAQIRHHHGHSVRSTDPPVFRFDIDISVIIDQIAAELQDDAVRRITDRRTAFVNGRTA